MRTEQEIEQRILSIKAKWFNRIKKELNRKLESWEYEEGDSRRIWDISSCMDECEKEIIAFKEKLKERSKIEIMIHGIDNDRFLYLK